MHKLFSLKNVDKLLVFEGEYSFLFHLDGPVLFQTQSIDAMAFTKGCVPLRIFVTQPISCQTRLFSKITGHEIDKATDPDYAAVLPDRLYFGPGQ
jgi:hypothetical protein